MYPLVTDFEFSLAGQKLTGHSGILELLDDLGRAMTVGPRHANARRRQSRVRASLVFFELDNGWPHRHKCLRVNFSRDAETVREGCRAIAGEAAKASA
jgi:alanine-alpha-ketoisovalerate/valine-pyruvate aminotransferase